jgi:hypothetical protein
MAMSWSARAARRGAGMTLFLPPGEAARKPDWHWIATHLGEKCLEFRPGIDIWRDAFGQRWTCEFAAEQGWTYLRVATDAEVEAALQAWKRERANGQ